MSCSYTVHDVAFDLNLGPNSTLMYISIILTETFFAGPPGPPGTPGSPGPQGKI